GETDILEKTTASAHRQQIANQLQMLQGDMAMALARFNVWLGDGQNYLPQVEAKEIRLSSPVALLETESMLPVQVLKHDAEAARWRWRTEKARLLPDFFIGYNNQSI